MQHLDRGPRTRRASLVGLARRLDTLIFVVLVGGAAIVSLQHLAVLQALGHAGAEALLRVH